MICSPTKQDMPKKRPCNNNTEESRFIKFFGRANSSHLHLDLGRNESSKVTENFDSCKLIPNDTSGNKFNSDPHQWQSLCFEGSYISTLGWTNSVLQMSGLPSVGLYRLWITNSDTKNNVHSLLAYQEITNDQLLSKLHFLMCIFSYI